MATMMVERAMRAAPGGGRQYDTELEQDARGQRDRDHVVARRPDEVLHHLAVGGAGHPHDHRDVARIGADQDDVGRLDRHVGARADGDAHVRLRQRGRVVDPVARHGDDQAALLDLLDLLGLLVGQHLGEVIVQIQLSRDPFGDGFGIAGDHHRLDAHLLEPLQRLARLGPDDVGQSDRAGRLLVHEHVDDGLALLGDVTQPARCRRTDRSP